MELTSSVAIIAGLLALNTLFFLGAIIKAIKVLGETQKFVEMARLQMAPISHDVAQILGDLRSITKSIDKEMDKVGEGLSALRDTAKNVRDFELLLQERIERPLLDVTAILAGLVKGIQVFWKHFSSK